MFALLVPFALLRVVEPTTMFAPDVEVAAESLKLLVLLLLGFVFVSRSSFVAIVGLLVAFTESSFVILRRDYYRYLL